MDTYTHKKSKARKLALQKYNITDQYEKKLDIQIHVNIINIYFGNAINIDYSQKKYKLQTSF